MAKYEVIMQDGSAIPETVEAAGFKVNKAGDLVFSDADGKKVKAFANGEWSTASRTKGKVKSAGNKSRSK